MGILVVSFYRLANFSAQEASVQIKARNALLTLSERSEMPLATDDPAVVLSSRGEAADKRRAGAVGADAYLVKSEFSKAALREAMTPRLGG